MAPPFIPQGVINRVRGSISFVLLPFLNVTAGYLGREGLRLAFQGPSTTRINTLTGQVASPEPYVPCLITVSLLRTQPLAAAFEAQRQLYSVLGDFTIRTDAVTPGIPLYYIQNSSIGRIGDMLINGTDPLYGVELEGTLSINASIWG